MGEIKLFGQKIVLQVKQETNKNEPNLEEEEEEEEEKDRINKRPGKIIACPRCKSMETKFCYFNNYNVNQPRHFCKGCQRYWTAGGALRNVPVGAGRRKAKPPNLDGDNFSSQNCLFDGVNMNLNNMGVDEWQLAAAVVASGGLGYDFPVKRRRSESTGQTC